MDMSKCNQGRKLATGWQFRDTQSHVVCERTKHKNCVEIWGKFLKMGSFAHKRLWSIACMKLISMESEEKQKPKEGEREKWSRKIDFLLACIGEWKWQSIFPVFGGTRLKEWLGIGTNFVLVAIGMSTKKTIENQTCKKRAKRDLLKTNLFWRTTTVHTHKSCVWIARDLSRKEVNEFSSNILVHAQCSLFCRIQCRSG